MKKRKCELLAPAGGEEQLIAAVENGADAVYLGGRLFNARMNAGNFSDEAMREAIDFAHKRNVKIHVTMNTLLRDDELAEALRYAAFLYEAGADALIIQDLGLASQIHRFMPDLPLHLSTQGTVYDLRGACAAGRLGFDRVVLARELSLPEIREICEGSGMEIEVFVHGALCVCYSGQCQLSRALGGRSGNRGACAQPCRLPFATTDERGKLVETFPYPLSPKDLCLIDRLGDLAAAGVCSFKIEGRMKSPEYVGTVTRIYRKYLERYEKEGRYRVSDEDREALAQIFNRGGFTQEYLEGRSGDALMSGTVPKHNGIWIGETLRRVPGSDLVDVSLEKPLAMGDGVEIRGDHAPCGNVVTYLKETKSSTRIGDIRGDIKPGDGLYRISSKVQLEEVRKSYQGITLAGGPHEQKRVPVDLSVIGKGDSVTVTASLSGSRKCSVSVTRQFAEAGPADAALDTERLTEALKKTGSTPYTVAKCRVNGDFRMRMKVSEMNGLRRSVLDALAERMIVRREAPVVYYESWTEETQPAAVEYYYQSWDDMARDLGEHGMMLKRSEDASVADLAKVCVLPVLEVENHFSELPALQESAGLNFLPYIRNVSRGNENRQIEESFDRIVEHWKDRGIYVGNLSWIVPFRSTGVPVYADYGLNVYNEAARGALAALGVRQCADSLEAMTSGNGRYPLMHLAHIPAGAQLTCTASGSSTSGKQLTIIRRPYSDQAVLVSAMSDDRAAEPAHSGEVVRFYR